MSGHGSPSHLLLGMGGWPAPALSCSSVLPPPKSLAAHTIPAQQLATQPLPHPPQATLSGPSEPALPSKRLILIRVRMVGGVRTPQPGRATLHGLLRAQHTLGASRTRSPLPQGRGPCPAASPPPPEASPPGFPPLLPRTTPGESGQALTQGGHPPVLRTCLHRPSWGRPRPGGLEGSSAPGAPESVLRTLGRWAGSGGL